MNHPRRPAPAYGTSKASSIRIRNPRESGNGNSFKMPRRQHISVWMATAFAAFLLISFYLTFHGKSGAGGLADYAPSSQEPILLDDSILKGAATAPKLENATLKYVTLKKPNLRNKKTRKSTIEERDIRKMRC